MKPSVWSLGSIGDIKRHCNWQWKNYELLEVIIPSMSNDFQKCLSPNLLPYLGLTSYNHERLGFQQFGLNHLIPQVNLVRRGPLSPLGVRCRAVKIG